MCVLSALINCGTVSMRLIVIGNAFHNRGPTTLNERSPKLTSFVRGTSNRCCCEERVRPVEHCLFSMSARYRGTVPLMHRNTCRSILNSMRRLIGRKGLSCESQLLELTHDLLNGLHDGKQTDLIVMDFAKAFDKVCHEKLLTTLHSYSVDPTTIHWIRGFLSNRSQSVVIEGAQSLPLPVTSGVPQGTVLGPALFLCYINSMPEGISSSIRLFADDTVIYRQINSAADHTILQQDLHKLARWEAEYSMEFHPEKCNVLRVPRSRSPSIFNYTLHGTNLKSTESTKYLGVTLTKDLTWGKHIDIIRAKANQQLAFVRRNIRTRSSSTKEKLFNTLVRPHLEYAATVWDPHISKQKHSLEMVQRRAARWVK